MINFVKQFVKEEDGQDMVEYALLLAFIGLGAVATLTLVKGSLTTMWTSVNTKIGTANSTIVAGK